VPKPAPASFPEKHITFIVAAGPGGGLDTMCRGLAGVLPKYLPEKRAVIVQNESPPAIIKGATILNKSKPDGYTISMTYVESCIYNQLTTEVDFDVRQFTQLGSLHSNRFVIVVRPDYAYKSLKEVVEAKERVRWAAVPGAYEMWAYVASKVAGIEEATVITGFKGASGMVLGVMRGDADMAVIAETSVAPFLEAGDLEAIMKFSTKTQFEYLEEIPSAKELGYEELAVAENPQILVGPPGMPKDIADILSEAAYKACTTDKDFITWGKKAGYDMVWMSPEEVVERTDRMFKTYPEYIALVKK